MRTLPLCLLLSGLILAQPQHREIVNPSPNPADDAKPNNPQVPDVYAITGQLN